MDSPGIKKSCKVRSTPPFRITFSPILKIPSPTSQSALKNTTVSPGQPFGSIVILQFFRFMVRLVEGTNQEVCLYPQMESIVSGWVSCCTLDTSRLCRHLIPKMLDTCGNYLYRLQLASCSYPKAYPLSQLPNNLSRSQRVINREFVKLA